MPELKNGRYTIPEKWENSAMGDYCFGKDNTTGKKVFIKKFNMYKYVADTKGLENLEKQNQRTENYRLRMNKINEQVGQIAQKGSDVVVTTDFFREGINLYKVTEYVDIVPWKPEEVHQHLTVAQIDGLMLRSVYALTALHNAGLLHCDLKPDNIFITKREGAYVGMVSDFDDSFFMSDIPCSADVVGTPEYMSPELGLYKMLELDQPDENCWLTASSDIFAMGLIYHVYLTGELPAFDTSKFDQFWALFWAENEEDCVFALSPKLDPAHYELLSKIFVVSPEYRCINTGGELAAAIQQICMYREREYQLMVKIDGAPAANKTFELYGSYTLGSGENSIQCNEEMTTFKTDASGKAVLKGLLPETPYSVKIGNKKVPITWKSVGNVKECVIDWSEEQIYSVLVRRDGQALTTARISLYQDGRPPQTMRTNAKGVAKFKNLTQTGCSVEYERVRQSIAWNRNRQFIFNLYTMRVKVVSGSDAAGGKTVNLFRVLSDGRKEGAGTGRTNAMGEFSLVVGEKGGNWRAECDKEAKDFTWNGSDVIEIELPVGTEVACKTVLDGSTTPLENVKVALCKRREDGKTRVLKSVYTDINGRAEFGCFTPGRYAVAVMEVPQGYHYKGKVRHPYDAQVGETRKRFTLKFLREFVLEHPEDVVSDKEVPEGVSKTYKRVIHYKDGTVILVMRNGNQQKVPSNMLSLYGLEAYKRS